MDDDALYRAIQARDARFDGRLFVGVKTTGIYCRPVCPARTPKFANVAFFPTAHAAQTAGFRPCLRCRPESAPDLAAWRGSSATVSRALTLIEDGALEADDVEGLADRLGVGERHLRRLFRQHLGASPTAVAQTRRVLLAKQLIHETDLSMTEVALASGFGSVRRFNETFRQLFGAPPTALRRRGAARAGGQASLRLAVQPPFDWAGLAAFFALRAVPGVEVAGPRRYARALRLGDHVGVVTVEPDGPAAVRTTLRFSDLSAWPTALARVRRAFDLAVDPAPIVEHLSRDPALAPLVAARPGLRAPGAWDGFELAVRAILGQQISVVAARRLAGDLTQAFGEPLPPELADEGLTHLFPTPQALAALDPSAAGMPRARAQALVSLAEAAADDPLLFAPRQDLQTAVDRLKALKGVGEWTAHYIALRHLREPDAFPYGDLGLIRALERLEGVRPTPQALAERAEAWRPWRAYAAQHLWTYDAAAPAPAVLETA